MEALKSGGTLLPPSKNKIVDSLATIITVCFILYTHPSSRQLEKVATKLISVYPNAFDRVPGGTAYVSSIIY